MAENILVVEDDPLMLAALEILLDDEGYNVTTASSGLEAIQAAKGKTFDLVVSDVRMAEMDGIETISNVKKEQPDTRAIVITGYASPDVPIQAIKMGVDDYIMKPFDDRQFVASVKRCLENYRLQKSYTTGLQAQWKDFASIIKLLAEGVEERDPHFAGHSRRVAQQSLKIGRRMGLGRNRLEVLELAAYLHDIGTIGQKEALLDKTEELMKEDLDDFKEAASQTSEKLFSNVSSLREVFRVILHHHEWFDGSGHPHGLQSDQIPIESRILCAAEAYDAMTSARPHRQPLGLTEARKVLEKESGTHFDPEVVECFRSITTTELTDEEAEAEPEFAHEETLSRERQVELMLGIAGTYLSAGDLETAGQGYSEALELLGTDASGALRSEALSGLALSYLHRARTDEARNAVERAVEAATGASQLVKGKALLVRGLVRGLQGELDTGEKDLEEARASFETWEAHYEMSRGLLYRAKVLRKSKAHKQESLAAVGEAVEKIDRFGLQHVLKQERHLAIPLLLEYSAQVNESPHCDRLLLWLGYDAVHPFLAEVDTPTREKAIGLLSNREGVQSQTPPLSLYGFGKFRVFAGGAEVGDKLWKTRKSKYLFAYLGIHAGRDIPDEKVMDIFWPDHPPEKARQSLYAALSHMRKALEKVNAGENDRVVLARKGFYRFNTDRAWFFDVIEFEKLYDAGKARTREARIDEAMLSFQKAEALYTGDFMEGYYADWALFVREELQMKYTDVLEQLMVYFFDKERHVVAADYANRLLKIDNCHQEAHTTLMRGYLEQGKPEQAARQYQTCSQILKDELNISPSPEMSELYLSITT
ncbi:MAG: response regulator [Armatimonadetes bacterium]|nr:response regulator [Armatimonadota bacterium]